MFLMTEVSDRFPWVNISSTDVYVVPGAADGDSIGISMTLCVAQQCAHFERPFGLVH